MNVSCFEDFHRVWILDFEFSAPAGETPEVVCLVALELYSGEKLRLWQDDIAGMCEAPYPVDDKTLFVAYYASAEIGCHLALGWPLPKYVLDLFTEFRNLTNGQRLHSGSGLLGALLYFGLPAMDTTEKESMRELAIRGGPWTPAERMQLLDYCESDVEALHRLLTAMAPKLDLPRAVLRGRYMKAAACMEFNGIPIDVAQLERIQRHWEPLQSQLISEIDKDYDIYDGKQFRANRFAAYLVREQIPWPRLPSGRLDLKDDTFRAMARSYPAVGPLRELRATLSQMRLSELSVGPDGCNRCLLSAFRSRTGRNQPSNTRFIYGPAVWLRYLIKPRPGYGLAYIDWSQQEFGIAAALSGDPNMIAAYESGDPYLEFAKQAGAVPQNATKNSHAAEREQFKACVLAVQYGMGEASLAERIGQPVAQARRLLQLHHQTYKKFWAWSDAAVDYAVVHGKLWTVFGWEIRVGNDPNPRFLRNFLMQANGAEMLRLACCLLTEAGVRVCAPVHDAVLIEAPLAELDEVVRQTQRLLAESSRVVLGGFTLRSSAEVVRYPERYSDERGALMWQTIMGALESLESSDCATPLPAQACDGGVAAVRTRSILLSDDIKEVVG